ncbi:glycosyltransferase [Turicibacter sp. TS3]|uniref:glycosyltransferase n=1 Tax=Turicibacter sp. TS3 TaxID=2304578 RepID=UPI00137B4D11|nr:glycosyltransferase [Turicibacter sp. TS3]NCE77808.1 glycosyltransferase [Turicibacter sp. TS3]
MRILHYTLGLPPYRSGGLTKYTNDLMKEQSHHGDDVYLLFPGHLKVKNYKIAIKHYKRVNNIKVYELINPLPVPLLKGIQNPKAFMQSTDYRVYIDFLKLNNIEIINLHTLMGLHKEFLIAAKELNIPIVYTTHDYFGLCPKVNFLDSNSHICRERDSNKCANCNLGADSLKKIRILQSKEYRMIKNLGIIDKLKILKSNNSRESTQNNTLSHSTNIQSNKYELLLEYYKEIFSLVDRFIFNSQIAKKIYNEFLGGGIKGDIVSITHKDIKDNRQKRSLLSNRLRLTYLGPDKPYKGYNLLIDSMRRLNELGYTNIILNIYGNTSCKGRIAENVEVYGKYNYGDLEKIFNQTDVLVVPSRWYETFGFITLEAISYGIPVLLTDKVGSKDILKGNLNKGIIIQDNIEELVKTLIKLYEDKTLIEKMNHNILNDEFNMNLSKHYQEINSLYNKILKEKKKC